MSKILFLSTSVEALDSGQRDKIELKVQNLVQELLSSQYEIEINAPTNS